MSNPIKTYIVRAFIPFFVVILLLIGLLFLQISNYTSIANKAHECIQNGYEIYLDGALVDDENITLESYIITKIDDENQKVILTNKN